MVLTVRCNCSIGVALDVFYSHEGVFAGVVPLVLLSLFFCDECSRVYFAGVVLF